MQPENNVETYKSDNSISDENEEQIDFNPELEIERPDQDVIDEYEHDYIAEYKRLKLDDVIADFITFAFKGKYQGLLQECAYKQKHSISIDMDDLMSHDSDLADKLLDNPKVFLKFFETVIYKLDKHEGWNYFNEETFFKVRLSNFHNRKLISEIDIDYNNKFLSFRGLISKMSEIKPYIYKFYYKCLKCRTVRLSFSIELNCTCENNPRMVKIKEKHVYANCCYIKVQELSEDLKGHLPKAMDCIVLGDMTKEIKAGSKVKVTGFIQLKEITNSLSIHTPFTLIVDAINIEPFTTNDLANLDQELITEEDEKRIREFRKLPRDERLEILVNSFAPHIFGHKLVKLGLLLAIVGSGKLTVEGIIIRDRIHVLLCGDPSISKSQLMKFGERITLGSQYASGRGTSATGITAAALKDKDGTFSLQPGVLVFANNSVFWFDETDKLDDQTKGHLHQSMEDGIVSLNKGGVIATLAANTTVVMAANPKHSRYSIDLSVAENINMPDSLISRFDFIFIMRDIVNEDNDRRISRHLDRIIRDRRLPSYGVNTMSSIELIKYLEYVKRENIDPEIDSDAFQMFEDYYIDMRKQSNDDTLAITARQKQGMIRTGRAVARILLDRKVEAFHAEETINLMKNEFETVLKDKDGNYNIAMAEGKTSEKLQGTKLIIKICKDLIPLYPVDRIPKSKIINSLIDTYNIDERKAWRLFDDANQKGTISYVSEGYVKLTTYS